MKPIIVIDPGILSIPNHAISLEEVQAVITQLRQWSSIVQSQNVAHITVMSDTVTSLGAANCFPAVPQIQAMLELFELDSIFSAKDINIQLLNILNRSEWFVNVAGVEVVRVEGFSSDGIDLSMSPGELVADATVRSLASVSVSDQNRPVRFVLASGNAGTLILRFEHVYIFENGVEVEPRREVQDHSIACIRTAEDFLPSLNFEQLWTYAENSFELQLPIILTTGLLRGCQVRRIPQPGLELPRIGTEFYTSCETNQAARDGRFANAVRQRCSMMIHTCYPGKAFGQQRKRDGAEAHREHITKSHEGMRVMTWFRPDRQIEFANVGSKFELIIEEGACDVDSARF